MVEAQDNKPKTDAEATVETILDDISGIVARLVMVQSAPNIRPVLHRVFYDLAPDAVPNHPVQSMIDLWNNSGGYMRRPDIYENLLSFIKDVTDVHDVRYPERPETKRREGTDHPNAIEYCLNPNYPYRRPVLEEGLDVVEAAHIFAACLGHPPGGVLIFNNIDRHIPHRRHHILMDFLIRHAIERDLTILFSCDSEQMLLRLQRRIAEHYRGPVEDVKQSTTIAHDKVLLYYGGHQPENGLLTRLHLTETGGITNYPDEIFGHSMKDCIKAEKARLAGRVARSKTQGDKP